MNSTTFRLVMAIAIPLLTTRSASAQSPTDLPQDLRSQRSDSARPRNAELREDFDQDRIAGWEFFCKYSVVDAGDTRVLAIEGGGAAVWAEAREVTDFTLKVRFAFDQGIADVGFLGSETSGENGAYQLMLGSDQVNLVRRQHLPGDQFPETQLAGAQIKLAAKTWHDLTIQAAAGQIDVSVDGQSVLSFRDPKPLPHGGFTLGAIGPGHVFYDQLVLVPQGRPSRTATMTDLPAWPMWSDAKRSSQAGEPSPPE